MVPTIFQIAVSMQIEDSKCIISLLHSLVGLVNFTPKKLKPGKMVLLCWQIHLQHKSSLTHGTVLHRFLENSVVRELFCMQSCGNKQCDTHYTKLVRTLLTVLTSLFKNGVSALKH